VAQKMPTITATSWYRKYHRLAASVLFPTLILVAITGVTYRWSRNIFGFANEDVSWLLKIHQGSFLPRLTVPWTGFHAIGLIFLISTGLTMMKGFWTRSFTWKLPNSYRSMHQTGSSFVFLLLAVTALSGSLYRWSRNVFGIEKENLTWLLTVHQGEYYPGLSVVYTLLTSAALLWMACTGITMLYWGPRYSSSVG